MKVCSGSKVVFIVYHRDDGLARTLIIDCEGAFLLSAAYFYRVALSICTPMVY